MAQSTAARALLWGAGLALLALAASAALPSASAGTLTGAGANWTFDGPGRYSVEVQATDPTVNSSVIWAIDVFGIQPPSSVPSTDNLSIGEDTPFTIRQTSANNTLLWTWRALAENLTVVGSNITWTFTTPGIHNITILVRDPTNRTAQGYLLVNVSDLTAPTVSIQGPSVVDALVVANYFANATDNDPRYSASDWNFTWRFEHGASFATVYGANATYIDYASGQVLVSVDVRDKAGLTRHEVRTVTINRPPFVSALPPAQAGAGEPWVWAPNLIDPEGALPTLALVDGPAGMGVNSAGNLVWTPGTGDLGQNFTFAVTLSDGTSTVPLNFTVRVVDPSVLSGNHKPAFASEPPTDASVSRTYLYDVNVSDADNDTLVVSVTGLAGYTFDAQTRRLSWDPPWRPGLSQEFEQRIAVSVRAFDGKETTSQDFVVRFRNPPNRFPVYTPAIALGEVVLGQTYRIPIEPYFSDPDDARSNLTFFVNSTDFETLAEVSGIVSWRVEPNGTNAEALDLVFTVVGVGEVAFPFAARDPSGARTETIALTVTARAPPVAASSAGLPWWLLLLLAALGLGALGAAVALRHSRASARTAQTALQAASKAPAGADAVEKRKDTYVIEGVFVIYGDGRLIYSKTDASEVKLEDPELVSSMFSAVQSFIKDSFQQTGELNRLGFGENTILIERGKAVFMAAIVYGEPQDDLFDGMRSAIKSIENAYAGIIEEWDGSTTSLANIENYMMPFLALTSDRTRKSVKAATTEKSVKMISELEFFQGFVRLKCGVKNDTERTVTKVTVSIDFNDDVLRLHHVEPDSFKKQGSEVQLGVLNPGEKVSVAYYFDPQICTESQIDGVARYRDSKGAVQSLTMKTRKAEVVCPIFFTKEHANTAMLKRLVEGELELRDSKVYNVDAVPDGMRYADLFALVKEVVLAHDVHLVRDFVKEGPYQGEGWFYGETKVKGYKIVIRASVIEQDKRIAFFAASTQMPAITGLLAEFNHTFRSLAERKHPALKVSAEFDAAVKEEVHKNSLMAQLGDELGPGETDQQP